MAPSANGCADIIQTVSTSIDARPFNRTFPQAFPRFVQHAIWRHCAQSHLNICNGNRIDDRAIAADLDDGPACPKLQTYWQFYDCGYRKGSGSCNEPDRFLACPLPKHPLRNGRLNQTAYSLFLFIRDIADGDLVAWIDTQLAGVPAVPPS